jgi:hypothetical protein
MFSKETTKSFLFARYRQFIYHLFRKVKGELIRWCFNNGQKFFEVIMEILKILSASELILILKPWLTKLNKWSITMENTYHEMKFHFDKFSLLLVFHIESHFLSSILYFWSSNHLESLELIPCCMLSLGCHHWTKGTLDKYSINVQFAILWVMMTLTNMSVDVFTIISQIAINQLWFVSGLNVYICNTLLWMKLLFLHSISMWSISWFSVRF